MPTNSRLGTTLALLMLAVMLPTGCATNAQLASSDKLQITVSITPQEYFVERIGGEHVIVNTMVGAGDEPHTYEPKPEQLKALSRAAAYVRIGVEFEDTWMDRISAGTPGMIIVDTTQGFERMPMAAHHDSQDEELQAEDEHGEGAPDPHVWLSPRLAKIQAKTIHEAMVKLDPKNKDDYDGNLRSFLADIDALDADIRATLAGVEHRRFVVFHPAWGYFARDYGLEMIPIEVGGQEPSASELADVISQAKEAGVKVIFAQPEFSRRAADTIATEISGEVLLISSLAPNWLENLRQVAETFARVLGE